MKEEASMSARGSAPECPYCGIMFSIDGVGAYHSPLRFEPVHALLHGRGKASTSETEFTISCHRCPECGGQIVWLNELGPRSEDPEKSWDVEIARTTLLYPKSVRPNLCLLTTERPVCRGASRDTRDVAQPRRVPCGAARRGSRAAESPLLVQRTRGSSQRTS